jgi:hypothetical protein
VREEKSVDEGKAIAEIHERLRERFPDAGDEAIASAIEHARASFESAKVRDFVPVLIEKEAKARLKGKR